LREKRADNEAIAWLTSSNDVYDPISQAVIEPTTSNLAKASYITDKITAQDWNALKPQVQKYFPDIEYKKQELEQNRYIRKQIKDKKCT
jgi:hypothetical protein